MIDLKALMFDKSLSQRELAEIMNTSQSEVSQIANAKRRILRKHIEGLIDHFGEDTISQYMVSDKPQADYTNDSNVATATLVADNGEYTLSDPTKSLDWTFPAGRLRDDSQQLNAYYMVCENGQIDMSKAAPIIDGTIKVEKQGINTVITVDGKDDAGNDVKGTFSGEVRELEDQSNINK